MKRCLCLIICLLLIVPSSTWAERAGKTLTMDEIQRIRALKKIVEEVDQKTMQQTIKDIEKTSHPQVQLEIREAMAKAYADIVKDQDVQGQKKKEWLYSMITLNMAYLQFGGDKDSAGGSKNLNKLIRQKLKMYLPTDIYHQKGFLTSLG